MTKHTPGPWMVSGYSVYTVAKARNGLHRLIADIDTHNSKIADGNPAANARLIAAAPRLLLACKWLVENIEKGALHRALVFGGLHGMGEPNATLISAIAEAKAVIADAEGGAHE